MYFRVLYHTQCEKYLKSKEIVGVFAADAVTCTQGTNGRILSLQSVSRNGGRLFEEINADPLPCAGWNICCIPSHYHRDELHHDLTVQRGSIK